MTPSPSKWASRQWKAKRFNLKFVIDKDLAPDNYKLIAVVIPDVQLQSVNDDSSNNAAPVGPSITVDSATF